jgi:hypothetical protein
MFSKFQVSYYLIIWLDLLKEFGYNLNWSGEDWPEYIKYIIRKGVLKMSGVLP